MIFNFKQVSAYGQALKTTSTDVGELSKLTSNLTLAQTANALSTKGLAKDKVVEILTNKGLAQAEAEATAAKIASTSANGIATFSLKAYTIALWENIKAIGVWMLTNPIGWIVGLGVAVVGAGALIDGLTESIEEQKEKLNELKDNYVSLKDEMSSLDSQIKENIKTIGELQGKAQDGTITLIEEDQLRKLRIQNELLKEQLEAKRDLAKEDKKELSKKNIETFTNEFDGSVEESSAINFDIKTFYDSTVEYDQTPIKNLVLMAKENERRLKDALISGDENLIKLLEDDKTEISKELSERSNETLLVLLEYQNTLSELVNDDGTFDNADDQKMWDDIESWKKDMYKYSNDSGQWNTVQIDVKLNDSSLIQVQKDLQGKFNAGTLTEVDIEKHGNLITALENANLILEDGQSVASVYLQYLNSIATSQEAVNNTRPDFTFNDSNATTIDNYQSKLSTLSDALDKIRNGNLSSTEQLDLFQQFPTLATETDNLSLAIQNLISENLESLKIILKEMGADDEILALFDTITSKSKNISLDETLSELESTYFLLRDVEKEVDDTKRISVDSLQSISELYPGLENSVYDYLDGKKSEQDIINDLKEEYETDLHNYKLYMAQKKGEDEGFYDLIVENLSDDLITKADKYGIELSNYSNYLESKLEMDKAYNTKKELLAKVNEHIDTAMEGLSNGEPMTRFVSELFKSRDRLEQDLVNIQEVMTGVDTSIDVVIPDFNTSLFKSDDGDGGDDEEEEFSETYDWIARSVENAERAVSRFDEKLANTDGFQDKIDVLTEMETASQNLVDTTKDASDEYEEIWTSESSKVNPKYKDYITGDQSNYTIQTFGDEDTYNQVVKAADAYDTWQESLDKHNDALKTQKEYEDEENSILLEREEIRLELHELENQGTMTASKRLDWLEEEKKIKENILKYNLSLATTEEERLRLQKEYDKYLEENEGTKYEIKKEGRDNKVSFYDSKIQDIQNKIDLKEAKGGQGTEEQYTAINDYIDKKKAVYETDKKEAKAMRDNYKYGTALYNKYNEEMQTAENNINDCTIAQLENNRAILRLPIKTLEDENKELQKTLDSLTEYKTKVENAIGYANTLVQDQIDLLSDSKENVSDYWDEEIKKVQEQKDALTESNDEIQRSIDLENAKYNLQKAIQNRTTRIYRKGEGFVFESDSKAVMDAQQDLDQKEYDNIIAGFDKEINSFNKQKENAIEVIDKQIDAWTKYGEQIDNVVGSYDKLIARQNFFEVFSDDALSKIMSMDTDILGTFETELNTAKIDVDSTQEKIDANELTIQTINDEADKYLGKVGELQTAQANIKKAITENKEELDAIDARTTKSKELKNSWLLTDSTLTSALGVVTSSHSNARDMEAVILDERKKKLEEFRNHAIAIYGEIATAVNNSNNAMDSLKAILFNAQKVYQEIVDYNYNPVTTGGVASGKKMDLDTYHSGGIVKTSKNKIPENLIKLTEADLKPNETLAKLLNGEVVLNNTQMSNMFDNLGRAYSAITPINKRESSSMEITIGDVNVYNPDNSDMIVNEIVKELPLKVVQKLHSK